MSALTWALFVTMQILFSWKCATFFCQNEEGQKLFQTFSESSFILAGWGFISTAWCSNGRRDISNPSIQWIKWFMGRCSSIFDGIFTISMLLAEANIYVTERTNIPRCPCYIKEGSWRQCQKAREACLGNSVFQPAMRWGACLWFSFIEVLAWNSSSSSDALPPPHLLLNPTFPMKILCFILAIQGRLQKKARFRSLWLRRGPPPPCSQ